MYFSSNRAKGVTPAFHNGLLYPATYIICRHGETDFNFHQRIQGWLDISRLSQLGRNQANELGKALHDQEFNVTDAFVSPLFK